MTGDHRREDPRHILLVDLAAQHRSIETEIGEAIGGALKRTDWILGADVARLEDEFASYCGVAGAACTDSGLSALDLALRAFGIGPGDEVITAANTFIATAFAITSVGATPVLVDVDAVRYTIDPKLVAAAVTRRTKAVIPVHLYGHPADMDAVNAVAQANGLVVIEDACQAHGAFYRGRRAGSLGDAAAFSFYPSKNLGAYGDGGVVVSNNSAVLDSVRTQRNYGQREKNRHAVQGFNRRLDTIQAAALRVKLRHLDRWNAARRRHADQYGAGLRAIGLAPPVVADDSEAVWHLYVVECERRDGLRRYLAAQGIETGVHYPIPIHLQPAYRGLRYPVGSFPVSERAAERIVSLPMYPELPPHALRHVLDAIEGFLTADLVGSGARVP